MLEKSRMQKLPIATAVFIFLTGGCESDSIKPEPAMVEYALTDTQREMLRPAQLQLITAAERGILSGAKASEYQKDLDTADDKRLAGRLIRYTFHLPVIGDVEQAPVWLMIAVDKKSEAIVKCVIAEPEW